MMRFLHTGTYAQGQVVTRLVESSRRIVPDVEQAIDEAWSEALVRPGVRLFDGPVCRLENWRASDRVLYLDVSRTSYRVLVGTNFAHPEFAGAYGADVMANPVGVSTALITADGFVMMGRRNGSVAYYPHRVHPFAGSLEVRDAIDLFDDVRRELHEELGLAPSQIARLICHGLAEDEQLLHPEAIFETHSTLTRDQVERQLLDDEHHDTWSVPLEARAIGRALRECDDLTPIARACLTALQP